MKDETMLAGVVGLLILVVGNAAILIIHFLGIMSFGGSFLAGLVLVVSLVALLVPKIFYDYLMGYYPGLD